MLDEWGKFVAEESDARGVEWLSNLHHEEAHTVRPGITLAHLKCGISEIKTRPPLLHRRARYLRSVTLHLVISFVNSLDGHLVSLKIGVGGAKMGASDELPPCGKRQKTGLYSASP